MCASTKEIQMKFVATLIAALFATGVYAADAVKKEEKKADAKPAVTQPAPPVIPAAPVKSDAKPAKPVKADKADKKDGKKSDAKPAAKKDDAKPATEAVKK